MTVSRFLITSANDFETNGAPNFYMMQLTIVTSFILLGFRATRTQRQFLENICLEDDLRSRIFRIFVVKFLACLPLLGFSYI